MINYIKATYLLLKESSRTTKEIMLMMSGFIYLFLAIVFRNPIFCLIAVLWTVVMAFVVLIMETCIIEKIKKRKKELDAKE